jgi:hypothetical protein
VNELQHLKEQIQDKIEQLKDHELYPLFGLSSQVWALKEVLGMIDDLGKKVEQ